MKKSDGDKNSLFFKKGDIIIYALVFVAIILSFLPIVMSKSGEIDVVVVTDLEKNSEIFSYSVASGEYTYDERLVMVEKTDGALVVTIEKGDKKNVLVVEKNGETYMKEANCSINADCVHSDKITKSNDAIICLPHKLEVVGKGSEEGEIIIG